MSAPAALSVDVTWSLEDARAWGAIVIGRHAALSSGPPSSRQWGQIIAIGGLMAASAAAFAATKSPAVAVFGAIFGYLLTVAGQWAYHWDQRGAGMVDVIFQHDPLSYEPRCFDLTEAALVERRPGLTGKVEWGRVQSLTREAGLIIVWITKIDGLPIPERCFPAKADADAFFAKIEQRMAAARPRD
jgi:hypothetical protein